MNEPAAPFSVCFVVGEIFGLSAVGGGERQVGLLRSGLMGHGVGVDVVTRHVPDVDDAVVPDAAHVFRYEGQPGFRLRWLPAVTAAALQSTADVYYQRGMSILTIAAARAAGRRHVPFVWAASSDADADGVARRLRRAFVQRRVGSERGTLRSAAGALLETYLHVRTRSAARRADLIIAQTEDQATAIRRSLGSRVRVEVCPSFGPEMPATEDGQRDTILWVGANKPVKRPALFLEIARGGPESFRYVMVGKALDPDWASGAPVHLVDSMSPEELVKVYLKSHVLVNTSSVEGFPNTFLEAWSCGTPVVSVSLDPGGVISSHGLGWVCEDTARAAQVLRDTQGSTKVTDEMRARCREYVARHHSRDHVLELHLGLFAGLARSPVGESR